MVLKIRDADGNEQEILVIKGAKGNDYALTATDKQQIAAIVSQEITATADMVIERSVTEIVSDAVKVGAYAFYGCEDLVSAEFPAATTVCESAFRQCYALESLGFPAATSVETNAFKYCAAKEISFPILTTMASDAFADCGITAIDLPCATAVPSSAFDTCSSLKTATFDVAKSVGSDAFYMCTALETVDLPSCTTLTGYVFENCYMLKAVILRNSAMCSATSTTFYNCCHILGAVDSDYNPNGDKDGYIYVPSSLVDTYKADSVWSTFASQIRALESYTVDGTTTGALDESKI